MTDKVLNINESRMKDKGSDREWKSVTGKNGQLKDVSSTQIGQALIFDEALRITPLFMDWVNNTCAKNYRKDLKEEFSCEEIVVQSLADTMFYLTGLIHVVPDWKKKKVSRHNKVNLIQNKLFPDLSFEIVWRVVEIIIDFSIYFGKDEELIIQNGKYDKKVSYTCTISKHIIEEIAYKASMAFYSMPMFEPPVDWSFETGEIVGGYKTHQFELVRAKPRKVDYSLYSQSIFDTVNYIQSTPWIVNNELLRILKKDIKEPVKEDFIFATFPNIEGCKWDINLNEPHTLSPKEVTDLEEVRRICNEEASLFVAEKKDYDSAVGKYRAVMLAIKIAGEYKDKTLYFPHSYDFRGRVYPLPVGLSPQGSDAVKALLLYKETEPLTLRGEMWMWAYLASLYGDDKLEFSLRIERGKELIDADYMEADEAYQFLSHQIEINKWVDDPTYIPNTRVHLDACNSGSQFTSAITGDIAGCRATNVLPTFDENGGQLRQDAYLLVKDKAIERTEMLISEETDEEALDVLRLLRDLLIDKGRKICKVPVMVSNYGGTSGGRADILWNMFRELGVKRKYITKKNSYIFGDIIGRSINGVLNGGKAFEGYIQKMNNAIARDNKAVVWDTSDGFNVVHIKNKQLKSKQISCMLPNSRKRTIILKKVFSGDVSSAKMKSAISPNYIHSLDAMLLRRTALAMRDEGIKDSDWIHDSFGCHPNHVDLMLKLTKQKFFDLVAEKPLEALDTELRLQVPDNKKAIKELSKISIPDFGEIDIKKGELDSLFISDWFFS